MSHEVILENISGPAWNQTPILQSPIK